MKTKRTLDKAYRNLTDAELMAIFNRIGDYPENRVKRTGCIKLRAAKFGDQILDFIKARRTFGAVEAAIAAEAIDWAIFFKVEEAERIEGRRNVMRANVAVGYFEPLLPYIGRA